MTTTKNRRLVVQWTLSQGGTLLMTWYTAMTAKAANQNQNADRLAA